MDAQEPRRRAAADRGVDEELQFHLTERANALVAAGLSEADARAQARREFGDLDDARRYLRQVSMRLDAVHRRRSVMADWTTDLRYALRRIRQAPAFALTSILTLALGLGANMTIFAVVDAVLVRPLPFPHAEDLYQLSSANRTGALLQASVSPVDLDDWRAARRDLADLGGYFYAEGSTGVDLTGRGDPRRLSAVFVSPGFLTTLGVVPSVGRLPRDEELVRGGHDTVVLLTHKFWIREFAGAPAAVGATLTLDGQPYDVIGVLPPSLRYPADDADVFVPYSTIPDSGIPRIRAVRVLTVVGRARPGVTQAAVEREMAGITARLAREYADDRAWDAATVQPLAESIAGPVRTPLLVLAGAVGLVLLMACTNVAALQLARIGGRSREVAVRAALGAGRGRLIRQLVSESLVLAVLGGLAGGLLAKLGLAALLALAAGQVPRTADIGLTPGVFVFAIAITTLAGLAAGIVPAWRATSGGANRMLHEHGRGSAGPDSLRLRAALVVVEIAVAMVLVMGAGLMARSFLSLLQVRPGYVPDHLLAVQFTIDAARHTPPAASAGKGAPAPTFTGYYEQVIARVRALPGIMSAAAVKDPPLRGAGERNGYRRPDRPVPAGEDPPTATAIHVSDGYFSTIGAQLIDGREFTRDDRATTPLVIVVNEAFARRTFPGERAVGRTILLGRDTPATIIGVVNDIRQVAVSEPARPTFYLDNLQNSRVKTTIVVRTAGEPLAMANAVRGAIWSIDPQQPITGIFTFDDAVSRALARPRLLVVLLGAFGIVGLVLGAVGVYGVLASLVGERRREIGLRVALGALPRDVRRLVLGRGLTLTGAGIGIGLAGGLLLARGLSALLYGIGPDDPATVAVVAVTLASAGAAASWLPARRASRLDPVDALRE